MKAAYLGLALIAVIVAALLWSFWSQLASLAAILYGG